MGYVIVIIVGLVSAGGMAGMLYASLASKRKVVKSGLAKLQEALSSRVELKSKIEGLYDQMVDIGSLRKLVEDLKSLQESLKAERGRITITQAELETVETRLRELEEIERELEASAVDTKEEMNILKKKQGDLAQKNGALKSQLNSSLEQLDQVLSEVEMSAEMQGDIASIKTELMSTQGQIDTLLLNIEQGNDQYFVLKKRYDALDIEYAQLYEKFSEIESSSSGDKK